MAKKKLEKNPEGETAYPRNAVPVVRGEDEAGTYLNHAEMTLSPELAAHRAVSAIEHDSGTGQYIDAPSMLATLRAQADVVIEKGDLKQAEGMLLNQATALQSLFSRMTEKAMSAEYMSNLESYMRIALRAQSQCRATLETLSAIKNPPVVYAKQANIAQGHQQVNNAEPSRTRESEIAPTQLSGDNDELCQDTRTPGITEADDPPLEALGEIHRPKDARREEALSYARIQGSEASEA